MTRCEGKTFHTVAHVFLKILFGFILNFYSLYFSLIHVASFWICLLHKDSSSGLAYTYWEGHPWRGGCSLTADVVQFLGWADKKLGDIIIEKGMQSGLDCD